MSSSISQILAQEGYSRARERFYSIKEMKGVIKPGVVFTKLIMEGSVKLLAKLDWLKDYVVRSDK